MISFGIKDLLDVLIVATMLYYLYRIMRESGSLNIFIGVLTFIAAWVVVSEILELRLIGTIMDKFMNIGLLILVILFQDQIKRFLVELGSQKRWNFLKKIFTRNKTNDVFENNWTMFLVRACLNMSKSKTGALIIIEQNIPLDNFINTGIIIDAKISSSIIENIFFKNSPLHDGAMIIAQNRIKAAGCILPVSHDSNIPRSYGLRHRSALGTSQETDALAIIVSEETGNISIANKGIIKSNISSTELEKRLNEISNSYIDKNSNKK